MRAAQATAASARKLWRRRWLRFLLVGSLNTAACYAVYFLLLRLGLPYPLANLGALVFGILFSFRTNSSLVFRKTGARRLPAFLVCWALLYGVNILFIAGFMRLGLDAYWAGAVALFPITVLSFFVQKLIVFGDRT